MASFITTDYVLGFAIGFCLVILIALLARNVGATSRKAIGIPPTADCGTRIGAPDSGKRTDSKDRQP